MKTDLIIALTRARVAVLVAGIAWLFGVMPPPGSRIILAVIVVAAIVFDGWIEQLRLVHAATAKTTSHDRYQPAA